jgi:DNA anti-recombination protein RmuC
MLEESQRSLSLSLTNNLITKTDYEKIARELNQRFSKATTERGKLQKELTELQTAMERMSKMFGAKAEASAVTDIEQTLKTFATCDDLQQLY